MSRPPSSRGASRTSPPRPTASCSLSSIVSHLQRSALGSSAPSPSAGEDEAAFDRRVAEMLMREAKGKSEAWGSALSDGSSPATTDQPKRKPNTRFLSSLIKNVGDHNSALLRQEAEAARKRDAEERRAAEVWRESQRTGAERGEEKGKGRERDEDMERRRRDDDGEGRAGDGGRQHSSSSRRRDDERHSSRRHRHDDDRSSRRDRDRDEGPSSNRRLSSRRDDDRDERHRSPRRERRDSTSPRPRRRSASPVRTSAAEPPAPASKMDKYFAPDYDPRLDLPSIPASGLLESETYGGWDTMLSVVRERELDRKELERREKDARRREREKIREEREERRRRKKRAGSAGSEEEEERRVRKERRKREEEEEAREREVRKSGLMSVEYKKRGELREWDMAKDTDRFA